MMLTLLEMKLGRYQKQNQMLHILKMQVITFFFFKSFLKNWTIIILGAQALELFRENYVSYPDFHSALEGVDYVIDQRFFFFSLEFQCSMS